MKRNGATAIMNLNRIHEEKARKIAEATQVLHHPNSQVLQSIPIQTLRLILKLKRQRQVLHHPNSQVHMSFQVIQGKELPFRSMLLMIKIVFEDDILQKLHADHMHILSCQV